MKKNQSVDLLHGPIFKSLSLLAIPIMATYFIQMAYTLYGIPCHKYEDYLLKMNNLGLRTDVKDMRLFRSRYEYSFTVKTGYVVLRNNGIIMVFRDYK